MSSYSLSLQELSDLNGEALATVMGPADDTALRDLLKDKATLIADLARAATDSDTMLSANELRAKLNELQHAMVGDKASKLANKLKQTHRKLAAASGAKGTAADRLVTAYQTYQDSIRFILEMVKRISKADNKIAKMHKQIAEAIDSSDEEGSDEEQMPSDKESDEFETDTEKQAYRSNQAEIDKKNKAKRRLAQKKTGQTNMLREALQKKREQYATERKSYQQQIFEHFDETLGGMSVAAKYNRKELELPKDLDKTTIRSIVDSIKAFFLHRATEYYAIIPAIKYIITSYNPTTGLFWEPPSKEKDYEGVHQDIRDIYNMSRSCYIVKY